MSFQKEVLPHVQNSASVTRIQKEGNYWTFVPSQSTVGMFPFSDPSAVGGAPHVAVSVNEGKVGEVVIELDLLVISHLCPLVELL